MQITVNGQAMELSAGQTGAGLLAELKIPPATVVAELNAQIIKREDFLKHVLSDGDVLELVTVVGGG